jgi:hypothetical protein
MDSTRIYFRVWNVPNFLFYFQKKKASLVTQNFSCLSYFIELLCNKCACDRIHAFWNLLCILGEYGQADILHCMPCSLQVHPQVTIAAWVMIGSVLEPYRTCSPCNQNDKKEKTSSYQAPPLSPHISIKHYHPPIPAFRYFLFKLHCCTFAIAFLTYCRIFGHL